MKYNTLRVRLDDAYWQMLAELCQYLDRETPDMVRKLIRDAYAQLQENPMSKKVQNLRNQLSKLGVNKAQADAGTCEGYPAIFVRWNGDEEVFTGYDPQNYFDEERAQNQMARFADDKLK